MKKQLKIALIVRKYSTSGGTERYVYNISKLLSDLGHKVYVVCSKAEVKPPSPNIELKKIFVPPGRIVKTYAFYILTKLINFRDFDIVQSCGKVVNHDVYRAGGGFHKLYLQHQKKRERISLYDKMVINLEKKIFNSENTKFVISPSKWLAKKINEEFSYPDERIKVIYNGVDIKLFSPYEIKKKSKKLEILFVSNDFKLKGLYPLIEAVKSLKDKVKLTVVGEDRFQSGMENINFMGKKNTSELVEILKKCDVFVHPTFFDIFSNSCLEAMATGLPVITTKINGISEIIDNYQDGIIIDYPDPYKIKEAITYYLNEQNLIEAKIKARKKAEKFSIENHVKKLLEVYSEVIKLKST